MLRLKRQPTSLTKKNCYRRAFPVASRGARPTWKPFKLSWQNSASVPSSRGRATAPLCTSSPTLKRASPNSTYSSAAQESKYTNFWRYVKHFKKVTSCNFFKGFLQLTRLSFRAAAGEPEPARRDTPGQQRVGGLHRPRGPHDPSGLRQRRALLLAVPGRQHGGCAAHRPAV